MQVNTGVRALLKLPLIYTNFQKFSGADALYKYLVSDWVKPRENNRILDFGCGPADILSYLPKSTLYVGYDISESYIKSAAKRFSDRGAFFHGKQLAFDGLDAESRYDIVMMLGVLHHLSDKEAEESIRICCLALRKR